MHKTEVQNRIDDVMVKILKQLGEPGNFPEEVELLSRVLLSLANTKNILAIRCNE